MTAAFLSVLHQQPKPNQLNNQQTQTGISPTAQPTTCSKTGRVHFFSSFLVIITGVKIWEDKEMLSSTPKYTENF